MKNPLINLTTLPPFSEIKPEHVEPAIDQILAESRSALEQLLDSNTHYTWDNLIQPLDDLEDRLERAWSPVGHMNSVVNSDELREAYNACLPKLSEYSTELGQNEKLFQAIKFIAESDEFKTLDTAQKKTIENELRDFRLSGIELDEKDRLRYKQVMQELSSLTATFEQNLMDATTAWKKVITDKSRLSGLTDTALSLAKQTAEREKESGWMFTLDFPSYYAVINYADDRELRQEMYTAYTTRASDQGPYAGKWDNTQVMEDILRLRHEAANLLGYKNYSERSLATKMARSAPDVLDFLNDLAKRSMSIAQKDLDEIKDFAKQQHAMDNIEVWDISYYAEKLQEHKYSISSEDLKPYFPEDRAIKGMFDVVNKLYGINIKKKQGVDVWHKDVQFFEITDKDDNVRGQFYLDLYARPKKRGGAWMDECISRRKTKNGIQTPVAYLTCNFSSPIGDDPALLTHDEVITLFHEFGHGLQHMLTQIEHPRVSGISGVSWDAVELPSQFMENFCWEREAVNLISGHYKTGEKLPDDMYDKMIAAKNFMSGMQMVRQLEFSIFDFRMHLEYNPNTGGRIYELLADV
ncbi:MAG: M3 family metallopeptidase, partial [Gammaproteobacteria bacterium]|nr:M3 family metallopeptidase [Gammaproteobacteria bacterium]